MYTLLPEYTFQTDRLDLMPLTLSHLADVERVISDPMITRGLLGDISTAERLSKSALVWITDLDYWEEHGFGMWAVLDKGPVTGVRGKFLGVTGADDPPPDGLGPELFYYFSRDAWGKGVATESVNQVQKYMFGKGGASALEALIFAELNPGSVNLAQKLGMQYIDRINVVGHHLSNRQALETIEFDLWCILQSGKEDTAFKNNVLSYSCFRIGQFLGEGVGEKPEILDLIARAAVVADIDGPISDRSVGSFIASRVDEGMACPGLSRYRSLAANQK